MPKDDNTMELASIAGAGPTSSYFLETMLQGRIKKLHFKDDLHTGKRKQIKRKLLSENKGVLLLDMRQEYNSKTEDYKDIVCDIILVSNDTNEFNEQMIETYKYEHIIKDRRDITGGERIEIKCLDVNNQEINFLTISFYTRENKTLIQGPHDNLMSFVNNHLNLEKSATHDVTSSDPNNMVINQTDNNIDNYETESELSAISSVNEEEYTSLVRRE